MCVSAGVCTGAGRAHERHELSCFGVSAAGRERANAPERDRERAPVHRPVVILHRGWCWKIYCVLEYAHLRGTCFTHALAGAARAAQSPRRTSRTEPGTSRSCVSFCLALASRSAPLCAHGMTRSKAFSTFLFGISHETSTTFSFPRNFRELRRYPSASI